MQMTKKQIKAKYLGAFFGNFDSGKDIIAREITDKEIKPQTPFYSIHEVSIKQDIQQNRKNIILNYTNLDNNRDAKFLNDFAESLDNNIFNFLFCFVKFDRIPIMKDQLRTLILPLINYLDDIVIIVTHFDLSDEILADKQLLNKHIKDYFRVKSLIVTSSSDKKSSLLDIFSDFFRSNKKVERCVKISKQKLQFTKDLKDNEYQKQISLLNQLTLEATKTLNNQVRGNRFTQENQRQLIKSYSQTPQLNKFINKDMTYLTNSRQSWLPKLT